MPRWLVSLAGKTITWRNESHVTASVVFDHESVRSGPIPPGRTYTYDPRTALEHHLPLGREPASARVGAGDTGYLVVTAARRSALAAVVLTVAVAVAAAVGVAPAGAVSPPTLAQSLQQLAHRIVEYSERAAGTPVAGPA